MILALHDRTGGVPILAEQAPRPRRALRPLGPRPRRRRARDRRAARLAMGGCQLAACPPAGPGRRSGELEPPRADASEIRAAEHAAYRELVESPSAVPRSRPVGGDRAPGRPAPDPGAVANFLASRKRPSEPPSPGGLIVPLNSRFGPRKPRRPKVFHLVRPSVPGSTRSQVSGPGFHPKPGVRLSGRGPSGVSRPAVETRERNTEIDAWREPVDRHGPGFFRGSGRSP